MSITDTRVYTQFIGGSALDARYMGTVTDSPEVVADVIRLVANVLSVSVHGQEVIAWGNKP